LTVSDNGHGLPASFKPEESGAMGMEIVTIMTEQLDGELKLIGGVGATFEIRFPL
jgi:two-component system, sensor histidine kinase PdtaS